MTDQQLLQQYVRQNSQAAFSQIVARHLGFVYTVCRRETGDAALAEDVTQVVFLLLARKAPSLRVETTLSGWLFQTARFASRNARRREVRRRKQEQKLEERLVLEDAPNHAWDHIEPHYNAALAALSAKDREVVLLRFADGLSFPELSRVLETSEDAARMRLNRAVSRLRQSFTRAGITVSAAVLFALLAERTVQAAPAACALKLTSAASQLSPQVSFHLQGALKAMILSKITLTAAALAAAAVVTLPFVTRAQNPAQKSNAASSPVSQPSLVSGSGQAVPASNPALLALNTLQLSGPFKLHYSLVSTDVSTPEMKKVQLDNVKRELADNVKIGYLTQADADERVRYFAASQVKRHIVRFDVTIASDGSKLFYQKNEADGLDTDGQITIIYDGTKTFDYDTRMKHMTVDPEFIFGPMLLFPLPGASVPHISLLQASSETSASQGQFVKGDVPVIENFSGSGVNRSRGEIALADEGSKTRVSVMTSFAWQHNWPEQRWEFEEDQPFQSILIASKIRLTEYATTQTIPIPTDPQYQKPPQPARVTEYRLISADTALSPSQFDPAAYLSPGDRVQDSTSGTLRAYSWHPGLKLD